MIAFGQHLIDPAKIFFQTSLVFCFVNIKPILPGHVLISTKRQVQKLADLTDQESFELWTTAQKVSCFLEDYYKTSTQICVQDGSEAGQSIKHIHIHLVPIQKDGQTKVDAEERKNRSNEEMEEEAKKYRSFFSDIYLQA